MSKLMTVWNYIRQHKYLITIVAFLVIIVFLDENSLIQRNKHRQEINALTSEIEKYRKQFAYAGSITYEMIMKTIEALVGNP